MESEPRTGDASDGPLEVRDFLALQKEEVVLRREEVALRRAESDTRRHETDLQYKHAERLLNAQVEELSKQREHQLQMGKIAIRWLSFLVFIGLTFIVFLLWMDKDDIVMEMAKFALYVFAGGLGGYSLGKRRTSNDADV